jgi:hypothetical protein
MTCHGIFLGFLHFSLKIGTVFDGGKKEYIPIYQKLYEDNANNLYKKVGTHFSQKCISRCPFPYTIHN